MLSNSKLSNDVLPGQALGSSVEVPPGGAESLSCLVGGPLLAVSLVLSDGERGTSLLDQLVNSLSSDFLDEDFSSSDVVSFDYLSFNLLGSVLDDDWLVLLDHNNLPTLGGDDLIGKLVAGG